MSKLDEKCIILTCPKCKSTESACAEESGHPCKSSWSRPEFCEFDIQWVVNAQKEPEIATAICKKCGAKATIESHYCP